MKKLFLTAFIACTVGLACAESGTYESIAGGTVSTTTNDFGNNKYSAFTPDENIKKMCRSVHTEIS